MPLLVSFRTHTHCQPLSVEESQQITWWLDRLKASGFPHDVSRFGVLQTNTKIPRDMLPVPAQLIPQYIRKMHQQYLAGGIRKGVDPFDKNYWNTRKLLNRFGLLSPS